MSENPAPASSPNPSLDPGFYLPKKPFWKDKKLIIPLALVLVTIIIVFSLDYLGLITYKSLLKNPQGPYDNAKITETIDKSIKSSIKAPYLPSEVVAKPSLSSTNAPSEERFQFDWTYQNASGTALLTLTADKENIDNTRVGFFIPSPSLDLNPTTAATFASEYFSITPQGTWYCQPSSDGVAGIYCENFWETKEKTKTALYVRNPSPYGLDGAIVVFCQIFPSSSLYSWKSCNPEFAQEGLK